MNVLLLTSHAIAEHDDLEMFTRMGVDCYSIGGAYDEVPFEGKRPPIAGVKRFPALEAATNAQRARLEHDRGSADQRPRGGPFYVDWAKADLAPEVVDWLDVVIIHHFPEEWLALNWPKLAGKRVIWRTCGQSDPRLENQMSRYRAEGLGIARYSPKERQAFTHWGSFAGEDVMIRFGKDPTEWSGWIGNEQTIGNITQDMKGRGDACGYAFWDEATAGLPVNPAGPGSLALRDGLGALEYDEMREYLRRVRVYLYTGTRPASYTLGFIEAMMTGTPILSIGKAEFGGTAPLLETDEIVSWSDRAGAREYLRMALERDMSAQSAHQRAKAIELFGLDTVSAQWADFLGIAS